MSTPAAPRLRGKERSALGEWLSAGFVLGVSGMVLYLLVSTFEAGGEALGGGPAAGGGPANTAAPVAAQLSGTHLFIITAGAERAGELSLLLAKEGELRASLRETPRTAEVIAAEDESEAFAIAEVIREQANLPEVQPISVVVVP